MATVNANYRKLQAGYLFPEIGRRTRQFQADNPGVQVMRLGIGNTTEPLSPAIIRGLHEGVEALAKVETYTGYGDEQGETALREALAARYKGYGADLDADEFFVSDGAKPDTANIQSIFGIENVVAIQDPAYPVYVDSNVIAGRTGQGVNGQYEKLVYMPCTAENGFFPDLPQGKVDLIYLCSPNNPTGAVATHAQLKPFVEYALAHKAVISTIRPTPVTFPTPRCRAASTRSRARRNALSRSTVSRRKPVHRGAPRMGGGAQDDRVREFGTGRNPPDVVPSSDDDVQRRVEYRSEGRSGHFVRCGTGRVP
jgi:bifunctional pyridoxal-dependent enzyme with beta-cystathionase and maltose regulon repressor activities